MSQTEVYLGYGFDTKQLRDAAYELVGRDLDISELCLMRVKQVDPTYYPRYIPLRIRNAVGTGELTDKQKTRWRDSERKLTSILRAIAVVKHPERTERRLSEHLQPVPPFSSYRDALLFFGAAQDRLSYLISDDARKRLDSIKIGLYAYLENHVLKRAIYEGVYMTQPAA